MFFVVRSNDSFNFPLALIKYIVIVVLSLSVSLCVSLSLSVCLSVCLSVSVSVSVSLYNLGFLFFSDILKHSGFVGYFQDTLKHSGFHVRQLSIRNSETLQEDVWNESTFTRGQYSMCSQLSALVTTSPVFPGQVALQVLQSPRHMYSLVRWLYKFCSHHVTCIPWSGGSAGSAVTTWCGFPVSWQYSHHVV